MKPYVIVAAEQSRRMSLVESLANVAIGYGIALLTQRRSQRRRNGVRSGLTGYTDGD